MSAHFSQDFRSIFASADLCFVATVNADGMPCLSPKASFVVYSDTQIAFADIASPGTIDNLRRRPRVEINVVDMVLRRGYRLAGLARCVETDSDAFRFVSERLWAQHGHAYPVNHVVVVEVHRVQEIRSPAYTFGGATEESLARTFSQRSSAR